MDNSGPPKQPPAASRPGGRPPKIVTTEEKPAEPPIKTKVAEMQRNENPKTVETAGTTVKSASATKPTEESAEVAAVAAKEASPPQEPPKKLTKKEKLNKCCKGFWTYIWNSKEKTFMGRGCKKWSLLGAFILMSYITLAFIFMGLLGIVLTVIHPTRPQYRFKESSPFLSSKIQRDPGIIFVPEADRETNTNSPIIWITKSTKKYWGLQVGKYLAGHEKYFNQKCNATDHCFHLPPSNFDERCGGQLYGWNRDHIKPSFIVRMTRIYGWKPEYFKTEKELKTHFKDKYISQNKQLEDQQSYLVHTWKETQGKAVIILCVGERSTDTALLGKITYCTEPYVDGKYFPFKNDRNYISPFIMIQIENAVRGIPISVECYPIAKNIEPQRSVAGMKGMDRFEFMID